LERDRGALAGGVRKRRINCGAWRMASGRREIAADAAAIFDGSGRRGSAFGDGEENIVEAGNRSRKLTCDSVSRSQRLSDYGLQLMANG